MAASSGYSNVGVTVGAAKEAEGIVIDALLRRGGEAEHEAIEKLEDGMVAVVHAAVGLFVNKEVESADAVFPLVDAVEHRGVGGEDYALARVYFLSEGDAGVAERGGKVPHK